MEHGPSVEPQGWHPQHRPQRPDPHARTTRILALCSMLAAVAAAVFTFGEWWEMHSGGKIADLQARATVAQADADKLLASTATKQVSQESQSEKQAEINAAQQLATLNNTLDITAHQLAIFSNQLESSRGQLFQSERTNFLVRLYYASYYIYDKNGAPSVQMNIHIDNNGSNIAHRYTVTLLDSDALSHHLGLVDGIDGQEDIDAIASCFSKTKKPSPYAVQELIPATELSKRIAPGRTNWSALVPTRPLLPAWNPDHGNGGYIKPVAAGLYVCINYYIFGDNEVHGELHKVHAQIDMGTSEFADVLNRLEDPDNAGRVVEDEKKLWDLSESLVTTR